MLLVSFFLLITPYVLPQQNPADAIEDLRPGAWRVMGPFEPGASKRFTGPRAAVSKMRPGVPWLALRESYSGVNGADLSWSAPDLEALLTPAGRKKVNPRERVFLDSGVLDLRAILAGQGSQTKRASKNVVYLYRPIYATQASTVVATCGVIGKATVWWNGKPVIRDRQAKRLIPDAYPLTFSVEPGLNHLLIEVVDSYPAWQFELRGTQGLGVARINRSVELGVDFLLDAQLIDGSWPPYSKHVNGTSALAVYTLIKSGISPRSEAVLKGLAYLRQAERAEGTYSAALELMALQAGEDPQDAKLIESIARRLITGPRDSGLWGYNMGGSGATGGGGDLSNTQYAALGLRAAAKSGVTIPQRTWKALADGVLSCKEGGGGGATSSSAFGFAYSIGSRSASPSMTAAGVGTLAICQTYLNSSKSSDSLRRITRAIEGGIHWLGRNWDLGKGPASMNNFYFLYGLERAGGLTGLEVFGNHAWYKEGARRIVELQKSNGRWDNDSSPLVECFGLLFLRRATSRHAFTSTSISQNHLLNSDLKDGPLLLRLSLGNPSSMWVDSNSENFEDIARVVYWLQPPGQTWRRTEEMFENRFAIQEDLAIPGEWKVRADAQLNNGDLLTSGTIEFMQSDGISPQRLAYATEGQKNFAPSSRPECIASSAAKGSAAAALVDGNYTTSWRCSKLDKSPEVVIKFRGRRKASSMKLVLAPRAVTASTFGPQPTRVEVTINDQKPVLLRIPTYRHEKAVLEFEKRIAVKKIKLRVISLSDGSPGGASVGFSELELY
jgi:hypothetical protein